MKKLMLLIQFQTKPTSKQVISDNETIRFLENLPITDRTMLKVSLA